MLGLVNKGIYLGVPKSSSSGAKRYTVQKYHASKLLSRFGSCGYYLSQVDMATIGIRREDKDRWERRVPLSPDHVQQLVDQGIDVIVQPSNLRIFDNESYVEAGAKLQEDLSPSDLIIAVKEVPKELLIPNKTYMFFSHTIKAQPDNMSMLDSILQKNIRLIDYEKIVDDNEQRLVRFGRYAGIAGMIDILRALGNRLLFLKHSTPFLHIGYTHMYMSLEKAKEQVRIVGEEITLKGLPRDFSPLVFIFTGGEGNCSQGAQEIFKLLPHKFVTVDELPTLVKSKDPGHRFRVYGCVVSSKDIMVPKNPNTSFSKADYYANPDKYECQFATKVAPYATVIVNNTYWDSRYPRLLTKAQTRELYKKRCKLIAVADISCDVNGSIEAMTKTTNIDEPLFLYNPITGQTSDSIDGNGIMFLSVSNLPTELPKEASCHFGDMLLPFLPAAARSKINIPYPEMKKDLPMELYKAIITANGQLTPPYQYIQQLREQYESKLNRILVLGAGYITPSLIANLNKNSQNQITIATLNLEDAQKLVPTGLRHSNIMAVPLDAVKDIQKLECLIQEHSIVISALPQFFHVSVAELCIKHKKHLVTASYTKPEMLALNDRAVEAGVTILNEIGLDPGIDHMSAVKIINEIHDKGGKVLRFRSVCGGLPAPEFADNPFYYKFSWSPRGVLEAGKNSAKFLENGEVVEVDGKDLFTSAQPEEVHPCFAMEVLPNRDSISYIQSYNLSESTSVFRGTLRYKGFSAMMWSIRQLGLLDSNPFPGLSPDAPSYESWPELLVAVMKQQHGYKDVTLANLRETIQHHIFGQGNVPDVFNTDHNIKRTLRAFEWLGFFDTSKELDPSLTLIDTLCKLLQEVLVFERNERDMILLQHKFDVEWSDGKAETLKSVLIAFGETSGESAMSKTVGYPLGIAAQLIMSGDISTRGVITPVLKEVYDPILSELKHNGIWFVEK